VIGSHLAHDRSADRLSRLIARTIGTPELGLRTRTRHVVRAAERTGASGVLDVGCGAGFTALVLASRDERRHVTGIDVNEAQIFHARDIAASAGLTNATFATSLDGLPAGGFDLALCVDTLEYVDEPELFLASVAERLRTGGVLVLHCRRMPTPRILARFRSLDPLFDGRLRPGYSTEELTDTLVAAGFTVDHVRETMRFTAEVGFELTHPERGPLRARAARYVLLPFLAPLARLDTGGRGAGLLVTAMKL
jgi:SAM-dependent methyltransferase